MRDIRVAAVQFEHVAGDKQANFAKIEAFVAQAGATEVEILAFPECCITGYWFLRVTREQLLALATRSLRPLDIAAAGLGKAVRPDHRRGAGGVGRRWPDAQHLRGGACPMVRCIGTGRSRPLSMS